MGDKPDFPIYKAKMEEFDLQAGNDPYAFIARSKTRLGNAAMLALFGVVIFVVSFFQERTENSTLAVVNLALGAAFAIVLAYDLRKLFWVGQLQWMLIEEFDRLRAEGHGDPVAEFRRLGGLVEYRRREEARAEQESLVDFDHQGNAEGPR